jgi:hypothetical protein
MLDTIARYWWLLPLAWLLANGVLIAIHWRQLVHLWREPVFRDPILIVESDDWGAGPLIQSKALSDIGAILDKHRDAWGHPPVFSLALILSVPDGPAIRADGNYRRVALDAPMFGDILAALREGEARGIFSLQLHGMEHFWPETLLASSDERVREWLLGMVPVVTEVLPAPLQSRWVNTLRLPSVAHDESAIREAVAAEVAAYTRILGAPPKVVVPPTFVWTREVETAWAVNGVEYVVTPGWRYPRRNSRGLPDGDEGPIVNGDRAGGETYLARNDYFEPARGRDAEHALRALERAAAEGRPCLLENHRDNFINDPDVCRHSLAELDKLYTHGLARHPGLRFLSTLELGRIVNTRDPHWLVCGLAGRLPRYWVRLRNSGRFWKLITLTGLVGLLTPLIMVLPSPRTTVRVR